MNLLPNLKVEEMVRSFSVKSNDYMYVIYVSALIRSILSLHDLVNNKILLMPIVSWLPDRTPSLFFLADTIIALQGRQTETRFA